jgi:hypothetical protein
MALNTDSGTLGGQNPYFIDEDHEGKRPMFQAAQRVGVHGVLDPNL